MSALEQFVNTVTFSANEGSLRDLIPDLPKNVEVLMKHQQHLDTVLETLDMQHHSIGVLAVLMAKVNGLKSGNVSQDNLKTTLNQVHEFFIWCNKSHVRLAEELYVELCHGVTELLANQATAMRGISLLSKAIKKIQVCDSQLTSVHADLCQLCLLAKCFKPALEFLDIDVTRISIEDDAKYFLLYFYYGGMIYTALKKYERALYFFEVCVMTPAAAVSHIMLEAYKKYILVSLILNGKIVLLPNYTSNLVKRHIKRLSQPYQELATAYGTNNVEEVEGIITKYQEIFTRDNNYGLVKQVLNFLYKKNIQRLTNTFLTLSLTDVAARVKLPGPADAEKYILNMIEDGDIFATINQKDGMVVFHDDPEKYDSPKMLAKLEKEMAECAELGKKVLEMEEEVIVTPQYVRKACGQNDQDDQAAGPPPTNVSNAQSQPKHNTYSM